MTTLCWSLLHHRWMYALLAAVAALAVLLSACGDGDDEADEHTEMEMSSEASDDHGNEHDDTAPGVVHPKPEGVTEVRVSLAEWTLEPSVTSVEAGDIYFLVDNLGPEHPHELVVIRTDLAPDALPTIHDGSVPEDDIELVGEIEEFAPRKLGVARVPLGSRQLRTDLQHRRGDRKPGEPLRRGHEGGLHRPLAEPSRAATRTGTRAAVYGPAALSPSVPPGCRCPASGW